MNRQSLNHPGLISALIYLPLALVSAVAFFSATLVFGDGGWVARLGGSAWVFLLSLIILMPAIIPAVKRRLGLHSEH